MFVGVPVNTAEGSVILEKDPPAPARIDQVQIPLIGLLAERVVDISLQDKVASLPAKAVVGLRFTFIDTSSVLVPQAVEMVQRNTYVTPGEPLKNELF